MEAAPRTPRPRRAPVTLCAAALLAGAGACDRAPDAGPPPIRFLHTFSPDETELVNALVAERGLAVDGALVPFARGQQVIAAILATGRGCPDLIRIDATWLPGLVDRLVAAPPALAALDWTPAAAALAQLHGAWWGVPQAVDGLLVVRDAASPAPASPALDDLVAAARAARSEGRRHPLGVRVDGYWLIPWLRAEGADLAIGLAGAIEGDGAVRALARFAALFGDVAAPPPPPGAEAPDELRRWAAHEVAYWVTGTWQLGALPEPARLALSPLAGAPRGGHLLVVPACAARPAEGWRLAAELASVPVEIRLAEAFGTVPTRAAALAAAPPLARAAAEALRDARMLPRDPRTPLLFDDLNPALAAVVAGEATAAEAIDGVRRGWRRLAGAAPDAPPAPGADDGDDDGDDDAADDGAALDAGAGLDAGAAPGGRGGAP